MQRHICRYSTDADGHWVAWLDCGHPQHVRHDPPFTNRPWVITPAGRAAHVGTALQCVRCDALELPDSARPTRTLRGFTHHAPPVALQRDPGVWARIVVTAGEVGLHLDSLDHHATLDADHPGIIPPELPYRLELHGPLACHVELYEVPGQP